MSIRNLPTFDPESADTLAVIETPKRSRNKFAYNQALDVFELKKVLPRGMIFPTISVSSRRLKVMMAIRWTFCRF
jgi:inorganic pyrophosphatase